jgi:hypothetical protein
MVANTIAMTLQSTVYSLCLLLKSSSLSCMCTTNTHFCSYVMRYKYYMLAKLNTLAFICSLAYLSKEPSSIPTQSTISWSPPTPLTFTYFFA